MCSAEIDMHVMRVLEQALHLDFQIYKITDIWTVLNLFTCSIAKSVHTIVKG